MLCEFIEEGHCYKTDGGVIVPSVTQIIKETRLASYDQIDQDILENRRALGAYVHKCTHYVDENDLDRKSVNTRALPYLAAWERFIREGHLVTELIEENLIEPICGRPLGGTPDRVGKLEGIPSVLDLKISRQRERWHGVQLAGYALILAKGDVEVARLRKRKVVQLREDETYRVWDFEDPSDFEAIQWATALVWFKRNNGIVTE